ncbi:SMI1/KNR4 family protein [Myroides sp. LJL115]
MKIFKNKELLFIGKDSSLSDPDILDVIKGCSATGVDSFMDVYRIYDGIQFPRGAMIFRSKFFPIEKGSWDKIEVEFFLTLANMIEIQCIKESENPEIFALSQTHIPFADDGCGNTIWMDLKTGVVKVFYHEYDLMEGLLPVAPSFEDFCSYLQNWELG